MSKVETHEICAEGVSAHLVKVLARAFGLDEQTVRAWRHPKESDLHPTGTGKRNPLDQAARYIMIVHRYNPGNARQAAQYFVDLADNLDRAECEVIGHVEPEQHAILDKVRACIKEGADVHMLLVGAEFDEHTLRRARREIAEEVSALNALDAVVRAEMERGERAS